MTEPDRGVPPAQAVTITRWTRPWVVGLVALSPTLLLLTLLAPWPWLSAVVGRAHPAILHFPIALLLLVAGLEAIEAMSRGKIRATSSMVLFAGSFSAVLAAVCGFLLMRADGVEGARVDRHLIGGIAVATLSVAALVVYARFVRSGLRGARGVYRTLLAALCFAVILTGHDGSALTHGENYLTEHLPWNAKEEHIAAPTFPTELPVAQWAAYEHVVSPILETRCVACHNSTNFKGKLVLDHWDGLTRGGKTGPLWIGGQPSESLLVQRLLLPLDDEKHMPPKKKAQMTPEEIHLLQLWVKSGAPAQGTPGILTTDQSWLAAVTKLPGVLLAAYNVQAAAQPESHEIDPAEIARSRTAVERALAPLRTRFPGAINYESRTSADLRVNASLLGASFGDAELTALATLAEWIVEMDLSETAITDASAPVLAKMANLRTLRLNATQVGDRTVTALAPLTKLASISLFRTAVSDAGAQALARLPALRRVYAAETKIASDMRWSNPGPASNPPKSNSAN